MVLQHGYVYLLLVKYFKKGLCMDDAITPLVISFICILSERTIDQFLFEVGIQRLGIEFGQPFLQKKSYYACAKCGGK